MYILGINAYHGDAAAARYAYERMTTESILAVRLMDARLRKAGGSGQKAEGVRRSPREIVDSLSHGVKRVGRLRAEPFALSS